MIELQHRYATTDIQTAKERIVRFLKDNDYKSYTYNELSTILNIDRGAARSACRYLEAEKQIISDNPKSGRKRLVYKYAQDSGYVCCYGAKEHLKRRAIRKQVIRLAEDRPGVTATEIYTAIRAYYFHIDRNDVVAVVQKLVQDGKLIVEESRRGSVITRRYYLADSACPASRPV